MSSASEFSSTVKRGVRSGRRSMVVHLLVESNPASVVAPRPRFGLIVSKSVGNAVVRHTVARRLRAAVNTVSEEVGDGSLVVVRALRPAAQDSSTELSRQLRSGLAKLGAL